MTVTLVKTDAALPISQDDLLLVTPERREKIKHLHFQEDKCASFLCGLLISYFAGKELGIPPGKIKTAYGQYGKPFHPEQPWYHFSVSHTRSCVVYVSADSAVGIDIEKYAPLDDMAYSIAKNYFTASEYEIIRKASDPAEAFYRIWTAKEAFLKCTGEGLQRPLASFGVYCLPEAYTLSQTVYHDNIISVCCKGNYSSITVEEISASGLVSACKEAGRFCEF